MLREIASRIASTSRGGLISLERGSDELLAAGLLAAELRLGGGSSALVAPVVGEPAASLVGELDGDGGSLALALSEGSGVTRLTIGYAALRAPVDLSVANSKLSGGAGDRIERVLANVKLALLKEGLGSSVARGAMAWALWPAAAGLEAEARADAVRLILAALGGSKVELSLTCLIPTSVAVPSGKALKVGKVTARFVVVDRNFIQRSLVSRPMP